MQAKLFCVYFYPDLLSSLKGICFQKDRLQILSSVLVSYVFRKADYILSSVLGSYVFRKADYILSLVLVKSS